MKFLVLDDDNNVKTIENTSDNNILTVLIEPVIFEGEAVPIGLYRLSFDANLPVDYNFEVLGVVSSEAYVVGARQLPPIVYRVEKQQGNFNLYFEVLFYNSSNNVLTGDLIFESRLLIKKINS